MTENTKKNKIEDIAQLQVVQVSNKTTSTGNAMTQ